MSSKLEESVLDSIDEKTAEIRKKQRTIQERRIEGEYSDLQERDKVEEVHRNIDLSVGNKSYTEKIRNKNKNYFENLKDSGVFINNDFKNLVPYYPQSALLIIANTGDGKSTASANLAYHDLTQNKKVLMITNEETAEDAFNRVTCICKGWNYVNHEDFSPVQLEVFDQFIESLSKRMTVIDNSHADVPGQTTTIEGIEAIFNGLLKDYKEKGVIYDTIILDYYQNIAASTKFPKLQPWEVQEKFCRLLDSFRKMYPAPISVMAQKSANAKDGDNQSYKHLVEGRKMISNVCTCVIEIVADRENLRTVWKIRKSRFSAGVGVDIYTGYRNGRYVPYTKEFRMEANRIKEEMEINRIRNPKVSGEGQS